MSFFHRKQPTSTAVAPAPHDGSQERTAPENAPPEVIAAIAAAVAVILGRPNLIVTIWPAGAEWSLEGRRLQLGSHQLRR